MTNRVDTVEIVIGGWLLSLHVFHETPRSVGRACGTFGALFVGNNSPLSAAVIPPREVIPPSINASTIILPLVIRIYAMVTEIEGNYPNFDNIEGTIPKCADGGDMGKDERRMLLLEFMAEHPLALPPLSWYRNLKIHRNMTFSRDTLDNYLDQFVEEGLAARVDKEALDRGKIQHVEDESYRAYYIITDKGFDEVTD